MKRASAAFVTGTFLFGASTAITFAQAPTTGAGAAAQQGQMAPQGTPNRNAPTLDQTSPSGMSEHVDDKKFVKDAALGGLTEVELGKLAEEKSSNDQVKQFAQKMIDDHTKAGDQLKKIATQDNMTLPTGLDSKHQARIDKLSKLSGPVFDKAYVKDQLKDHESDVREFTAESQSGSDPNVKAFASTTLPVLQQHLELIKDLNKTEKQTSSK